MLCAPACTLPPTPNTLQTTPSNSQGGESRAPNNRLPHRGKAMSTISTQASQNNACFIHQLYNSIKHERKAGKESAVCILQFIWHILPANNDCTLWPIRWSNSYFGTLPFQPHILWRVDRCPSTLIVQRHTWLCLYLLFKGEQLWALELASPPVIKVKYNKRVMLNILFWV